MRTPDRTRAVAIGGALLAALMPLLALAHVGVVVRGPIPLDDYGLALLAVTGVPLLGAVLALRDEQIGLVVLATFGALRLGDALLSAWTLGSTMWAPVWLSFIGAWAAVVSAVAAVLMLRARARTVSGDRSAARMLSAYGAAVLAVGTALPSVLQAGSAGSLAVAGDRPIMWDGWLISPVVFLGHVAEPAMLLLAALTIARLERRLAVTVGATVLGYAAIELALVLQSFSGQATALGLQAGAGLVPRLLGVLLLAAGALLWSSFGAGRRAQGQRAPTGPLV